MSSAALTATTLPPATTTHAPTATLESITTILQTMQRQLGNVMTHLSAIEDRPHSMIITCAILAIPTTCFLDPMQ
jgi:hypothetical protein